MTVQTAPQTALRNAYDVEAIRRDFPILATKVRGKPLVFLDSGASAQKPRQVIDTLRDVYEAGYANIHRGVYQLSQVATERFEAVRGKVARFIGAGSPDEIVFTRNATEAVNLVAQSYGRTFWKEGDEVVISAMEHHANIVPWQILATQIGIKVRVAPIDDRGVLILGEFAKLLGARTKLVAITHCSNVLGTVTPAAEIVRLAHAKDIPVLFDGAQAVVHEHIDVRALDADFYVFTGHKLYGPSGTGVLYGKKALLAKMPPYQGGGDMIAHVSFDGTSFREPPYRFEAGTPAIAEVIGLGAAIDYVERVGRAAIAEWEHGLRDYATAKLAEIPGLTIYGTAPDKAAIVSFALDCAHPHDIGTILDGEGVAIRAGHHCAEPLMDRLGVPATARASFAMYNTPEDADALVAAIHKVRDLFA
ncbi:MAG: cysteine desulfurase [Rhodospirillaceae bacterium]|nr:cysteine desulfurase [Rhodospirillaceae bacterium]